MAVPVDRTDDEATPRHAVPPTSLAPRAEGGAPNGTAPLGSAPRIGAPRAPPGRFVGRDALLLAQPVRVVLWAALWASILARAVLLARNPRSVLDTCDGRAYWDMGQSLANGSGFSIQDPALLECAGIESLGPSHHFSPLLPLLEAAASWAAGVSVASLHATLFLVSAGAVWAVYWATRDLLGGDAALLVGNLAGWHWSLIFYGTSQGYSESLVAMTFALTVWAIVRSLERPWFIVAAGLCAGLGYLAKASVGWFFLLAGLGGLAWRLHFHGLRVLRDRAYLAAIGVFALLAVPWMARNIAVFWDGSLAGIWTAWQTSPYATGAVEDSLARPARFALALLLRLPIMALGLVTLLPLWPELRNALRHARREDASALWLAAALLMGLGWLFAAAFLAFEALPRPLLDIPWWVLSWERYSGAAIVPLAWWLIAFGERPPSMLRWAATGAIVLAFSVYFHAIEPLFTPR